MRTVTIHGSTGSVGRTTVELLQKNPTAYKVDALTAGTNWQLLAQQALKLKPRYVAVADDQFYQPLRDALHGHSILVGAGEDAVIEASDGPADWIMAAIVGNAGLAPTIAAVRRGVTVAFANKECLVSAGAIMMDEVKKSNATLLPVDSEHNAIFQVFEAENAHFLERIILTASGGPFRECSVEEMTGKSPEEALAHPNWDMGPKISIDSATMMNKGLEIIEAHHLFNIEEKKIDVLVHPQSIVHSLVSYCDGSILAQLAPPDMTVPIAYTLAWPHRMRIPMQKLNLSDIGSLNFYEPDHKRFPALELARHSIRAGGNSNLVLNAANEMAVGGFLAGIIKFTDIIPVVEAVMAKQHQPAPASIEEIYSMDKSAREIANAVIETISL